jgi:hypothetical protein
MNIQIINKDINCDRYKEFADNIVKKYNLNADSITNIDVKRKIYKVCMIQAAEDMLEHQISKGNIIANADGSYMMGNQIWVNKDILISDILSENQETLFKVSTEYINIIKAHIKVNENNALITQKKENITVNETKLNELRELLEKEKTRTKDIYNELINKRDIRQKILLKLSKKKNKISNELTNNLLAVDALGRSDKSNELTRQQLLKENESILTQLEIFKINKQQEYRKRLEQIEIEKIKLAELQWEAEKNKQHQEVLTNKIIDTNKREAILNIKLLQEEAEKDKKSRENQTESTINTINEIGKLNREQSKKIADEHAKLLISEHEKNRQHLIDEQTKTRDLAEKLHNERVALEKKIHDDELKLLLDMSNEAKNNTMNLVMNQDKNTQIIVKAIEDKIANLRLEYLQTIQNISGGINAQQQQPQQQQAIYRQPQQDRQHQLETQTLQAMADLGAQGKTEKDLTTLINHNYGGYVGKLHYDDTTKKYGIYNFGQGMFGPVPKAFVHLKPGQQPVDLNIPIPNGYKIQYEPSKGLYYYVEYWM